MAVENTWNAAVPDVRLRFYLSRDKAVSPDDYQMGDYWSWNSFGAESVSVGDYSTTIPTNVPSGTYHVCAFVTITGFDPDAMMANNATYFLDPITVVSPTEPLVDSFKFVERPGRSLELKLGGGYFEPGLRVFVGEE